MAHKNRSWQNENVDHIHWPRRLIVPSHGTITNVVKTKVSLHVTARWEHLGAASTRTFRKCSTGEVCNHEVPKVIAEPEICWSQNLRSVEQRTCNLLITAPVFCWSQNPPAVYCRTWDLSITEPAFCGSCGGTESWLWTRTNTGV